MTLVELLTLVGLAAGPIAAVQLTVWLERRRRAGDQSLATFRTLMATRALRLSAEHVTALNMIDVAFYGRKPDRQSVVRAWHEYFENLHVAVSESVVTERERLFVVAVHPEQGVRGPRQPVRAPGGGLDPVQLVAHERHVRHAAAPM